MTARGAFGLRLSLFYAAFFTVTGIQLPYWPLYLQAKGLRPSEIGLALAAPYIVRIFSAPAVGSLADRQGEPRRPLMLLALATLLATALFALADNFWTIMAVTLLSQAAFTAILPLGDSLAVRAAMTIGLDYGRIRLWGSLSFILIATLSGRFLVGATPPVILVCALACLGLCLAATLIVPEAPPRRQGPKAAKRLRDLLADPVFLLFLTITSLLQVSHMTYYGFATLHWRMAGLSGTLIGLLWGGGVLAEVVLFAFGAPLVRRFGPHLLLAGGGLAGVIRWSVLGLTTDPRALAPAQLLHAFTFAASHLGAMHFIGRFVPEELSARAQGLYASMAMGVVSGFVMLLSGALYQRLAGGAFLVMALLSLTGLLLAVILLRSHGRTLRIIAPG